MKPNFSALSLKKSSSTKMKVKELQHWSEDVGLTTMPWHNKDWQSILQLLSKILADDLIQRKHLEEHGDITFKISFDALLQIAEDILGIPYIVVEGDLSNKYPNANLALLTYLLCMKQSLQGVDTKIIKDAIAPKLVFEADTTAEKLPNCVACGLFAYLIERVVVDRKVWHRRCFVCSSCNKQLYRGSYRSLEDGKYECVEHFAAKILSKFTPKSGSNDSGIGSAGISRRPILAHKPRISGDETNTFEEDEPSLNRRLSEMSTGGSVKARLPPPRPPPPSLNRVSAIIQKQMQVHVNTEKIHGQNIINEVVEIQRVENNGDVKVVENLKIEVKPTPKPRSNVPSIKSSPGSSKKVDISEYPGFLNPFGTDDEEDDDDSSSSDDDYNDSLNPFAEDEEDEKEPSTPIALPQPQSQPSPQPSIKVERPKSTPPPPPKPPRVSLIPQEALMSSDNNVIDRFKTLPRAKKTYRAPPPPIPVKRKIEFTENRSFETLEAIVDELKRVKSEHERLESIGRNIEKEILFKLARDNLEWKKDKRIEEWVGIVEQKCSTVRREAVLIHVWLEKYLNDIHADTEYQLRCVLERCEEGKDRSQEDVSREAELLEVLVDIMSLKNGMIESGVDPNSLLDSQTTKSSAKKNSSKMKEMKIRLKKLKKKL